MVAQVNLDLDQATLQTIDGGGVDGAERASAVAGDASHEASRGAGKASRFDEKSVTRRDERPEAPVRRSWPLVCGAVVICA